MNGIKRRKKGMNGEDTKGIILLVKSRDNAVSIATVHGLDGREFGVRVSVRTRFFSSPLRPDRFWGPSSLVSNEYLGSVPVT
jgi:hypothetical protein